VNSLEVGFQAYQIIWLRDKDPALLNARWSLPS